MVVTQDGTVRCFYWGDRPFATPPDLYAVAGLVLASNPRVYIAWFAEFPAPGFAPLPPQH